MISKKRETKALVASHEPVIPVTRDALWFRLWDIEPDHVREPENMYGVLNIWWHGSDDSDDFRDAEPATPEHLKVIGYVPLAELQALAKAVFAFEEVRSGTDKMEKNRRYRELLRLAAKHANKERP